MRDRFSPPTSGLKEDRLNTLYNDNDTIDKIILGLNDVSFDESEIVSMLEDIKAQNKIKIEILEG